MEQGYVKLWRKSLESGLMQNANLWVFWSWCLMKASHKKHKQMVGMQMVELEPGQFIFGRKVAALELQISEQTIRTCLKSLKNLKNLTIKTTNKLSIISIVNWGSYQQDETQTNQQTNQQLTNNQPTTNHKQECKECKEYIKPSAPADAGCEIYKTKKGKTLSGKRLSTFMAFWNSFDYKRGKSEAADAWLNIPSLTDSLVEQICVSAKKECQGRDRLKAEGKNPKMAEGWLSGRRWEDEAYSVNSKNRETPEEILEKWGITN